jgi:hypothetical protein
MKIKQLTASIRRAAFSFLHHRHAVSIIRWRRRALLKLAMNYAVLALAFLLAIIANRHFFTTLVVLVLDQTIA